MGTEFSVLHASDLAANLPLDSRCMRAHEPALEWDKQDHLLAEAVNTLRLLLWIQTKDGVKGRNRPVMIEPPKPKQSEKRRQTSDELRSRLSRPRKGA